MPRSESGLTISVDPLVFKTLWQLRGFKRQRDVGEAAGVSQQTISRLGSSGGPCEYRGVLAVAEVLGVPLRELGVSAEEIAQVERLESTRNALRERLKRLDRKVKAGVRALGRVKSDSGYAESTHDVGYHNHSGYAAEAVARV